MNIFISYFYQIRFFTPDLIPLSTAAWDPKWYHNFQGPAHKFVDDHGVLNGSRAENLVLPLDMATQLRQNNQMCSKQCSFRPPDCPFMHLYRTHLNSLDFNGFLDSCKKFATKMSERLDLATEPTIILLVHEAPTVQCSERIVLQDWFKAHGHDLQEWRNIK